MYRTGSMEESDDCRKRSGVHPGTNDMFPNCSPTLDSRPPYVFPGLEHHKGHSLLVIAEKVLLDESAMQC